MERSKLYDVMVEAKKLTRLPHLSALGSGNEDKDFYSSNTTTVCSIPLTHADNIPGYSNTSNRVDLR